MTIATATTAQKIAAAADAHAMWAHDIVKFSDIMQEFDIDPADATDAEVEAAHQLGRNAIRNLRQRIETRNERILGTSKPATAVAELKAPAPKERKKPVRRKQTKKALVFDKYAVTAVLRWMGAQGDWSKSDAALAILTLTGFNPADTTVRLQLKAGKDGLRGEPAAITQAEARRLRKATK